MDLNAPISAMFTSVGSTTTGNTEGIINTAGSLGGVGSNSVSYAGYYWPWYEPYNNYYHGCYQSFTTADKFETAFKLARKLMDKKMVKPLKTIEDFFKLMDSIVEVL